MRTMIKGGLPSWQKLRGMICSDNEDISRRGVQYFIGLANAYVARIDDPQFRGALQEFAVRGHFPDAILSVIERVPEYKDFDMGYEAIFDLIDYTNSGKEGFKIRGVVNGLAFAEVPVGGKAKVYGISGTDVPVSFVKYGAGLDIARELFDDEDYYSIADALTAFRGAEGQKRASVFYGLIEAVATTQNTTWQGATGDAESLRDIKTINSACGSIISDLKDKGMELGNNPPFILLSPDTASHRRRHAQALNVTGQAYAGSPSLLSYNVSPLFSQNLASTTDYFIILPKRKLKGGNRMSMTLLNEDGALTYSHTIAGWGRYGGAIGQVKQIRRCKVS